MVRLPAALALRVAVALVLGSVTFDVSSFAAEVERFRDWQVARDEASGTCVASTELLLSDSQSQLVQWTLVPISSGNWQLISTVPNGARLAQAPVFFFEADRTGTPFTWVSCSAAHCVAEARISASDLAKFKARTSVRFVFHPTLNSAPLSVPISLMGVTRALEAVSACASR